MFLVIVTFVCILLFVWIAFVAALGAARSSNAWGRSLDEENQLSSMPRPSWALPMLSLPWKEDDRYVSPLAWREQVQLAASVCKTKTLLVLGIGRNIEAALPAFERSIAGLRFLFESVFVRILENDSTDRSGTMLREWELQDPSVRVRTGQRGLPPPIQTSNRTLRLGQLRNEVQRELASDVTADFALWADMDLPRGFDPAGVVHAVGLLEKTGTSFVCAHGYFGSHKAHYDLFALETPSVAWPGQNEILIRAEWKKTENWGKGDAPRAARSCFGGAALYRWKELRRCTFVNERISNRGECEHRAVQVDCLGRQTGGLIDFGFEVAYD